MIRINMHQKSFQIILWRPFELIKVSSRNFYRNIISYLAYLRINSKVIEQQAWSFIHIKIFVTEDARIYLGQAESKYIKMNDKK